MELDEHKVNADPVKEFQVWFENAGKTYTEEANAMILSTVDNNHRPSSRAVLLKDYSAKGFSFYTNYNSRKAKEIENNPFVSLLFYWPTLGQQVRIEGKLSKLSLKESEEYFRSRPRESRIGAWASYQSHELHDRKELDDKIEKFTKEFEGIDVPKPEWWGGFLLVPDRFEFWQGRESRLHDRVTYTLQNDNSWKICRLSP
ncbi:pyridoxamine 5'-phosphate oxidase [soil metagenome]